MSYISTYDLYNAMILSRRSKKRNNKKAENENSINDLKNINIENNEILKENDKVFPLG